MYKRQLAGQERAVPLGHVHQVILVDREVPAVDRHLAIHEDHLVHVTERDRPLLSGEGLTAFTWTGDAATLRARLDATAAAGTTEILYQPCGPDIGRELRAFMTMASA